MKGYEILHTLKNQNIIMSFELGMYVFVCSLSLLLFMVICISWVRKSINNCFLCNKNAYKHLVKSGFFKMWLLIDVYGIMWNPTNSRRQLNANQNGNTGNESNTQNREYYNIEQEMYI